MSANKLRVELDRKQGSLSARIISGFSGKPDYYIATMLVGNNFSLVIYGLQMAILLNPMIHRITEHHTWILIVQTLVATAIILFTAEFMPKAIFRAHANQMLRVFAIPLFVLFFLLYPITWIAVNISHLMLKRIFRVKSTTEQNSIVFGKFDLDHLVNENPQDASNPKEMDQNIKLFQNALDFSNVRLRDCMIPRTEIEALEVVDSIGQLRERFIQTGYSRVIIFDDQIDRVIGYTHSSDLFKDPKTIREIVRPITIVPETMPANKLLAQMLNEHRSLAVVVDEFGGTAGLVTTEDILEEIFGDIEDEHDRPDYIEKRLNDHEYRFSGRLEIDYLNDTYHFNLPSSEEYETLAGLIIYHHTSIPKINETIRVERFTFKIIRSTNTRIELVEVIIDG